MAREDKKKLVKDLAEKMEKSQSMIFTDYRGLDVAEMNELRRKLRDAGVEYRVVKNTLARFAAEKANIKELEVIFTGPTAIAFGIDDPVTPARILVDYSKENKELEIKGGTLEGKPINISRVDYLAKIPSREELLAKALGSMKAPVTGLVNTLGGILRKPLYALNAIKEQKSQ